MTSTASASDFTFTQLCRITFQALRGSYGKSLGVVLISILLNVLLSVLITRLLNAQFNFLNNLLLFPLTAGGMLYFLRLVRHEAAPVASIFEPFRQYFRMLWGYIRVNLFLLLWALPLIAAAITMFAVRDSESSLQLLLLPLIPVTAIILIVAIFRYMFTYFVMLDNPQMKVRDCMRQSINLIYGYKLKIFWYSVIWSLGCGLCIVAISIILAWLVHPLLVLAALLLPGLLFLPLYGTFVAACYDTLAGAAPAVNNAADIPENPGQTDDSTPF